MFENEGVELSGSLLASWIGKCTKLLERMSDAIRDHLLEGGGIFMDDTTVKLLQKVEGARISGSRVSGVEKQHSRTRRPVRHTGTQKLSVHGRISRW
jgi:hypothetical protein